MAAILSRRQQNAHCTVHGHNNGGGNNKTELLVLAVSPRAGVEPLSSCEFVFNSP